MCEIKSGLSFSIAQVAGKGAKGAKRRASVSQGGIGVASGSHSIYIVHQTRSSRKIKELGKKKAPETLQVRLDGHLCAVVCWRTCSEMSV